MDGMYDGCATVEILHASTYQARQMQESIKQEADSQKRILIEFWRHFRQFVVYLLWYARILNKFHSRSGSIEKCVIIFIVIWKRGWISIHLSRSPMWLILMAQTPCPYSTTMYHFSSLTTFRLPRIFTKNTSIYFNRSDSIHFNWLPNFNKSAVQEIQSKPSQN